LIQSNDDLIAFAKEFPEWTRSRIIEYVLNYPKVFTQLINETEDLEATAKAFPKYAHLFNYSTIAEAQEAIARWKSKGKTALPYQMSREHFFFSSLSPVVLTFKATESPYEKETLKTNVVNNSPNS
jgi:hypothetical protein